MANEMDCSEIASDAIELLKPIIIQHTGLILASRLGRSPHPNAEKIWLLLIECWKTQNRADAILNTIKEQFDIRIYDAIEREIEETLMHNTELRKEIGELVERPIYFSRFGRGTMSESPIDKWDRITASKATEKYTAVTIYYGTSRGQSGKQELHRFYGSRRGALEFGRLEVSIPYNHIAGEIESPKWFRLELTSSPYVHITLLNIRPSTVESAACELQDALGQANRREILVYVHGYNSGFKEAALRTAQLAYDLMFPGVPLLFSWPSIGGILPYDADQESSEAAAIDFAEFLNKFVLPSGAERVHLIAHSMGTRTLTSALRQLVTPQSNCFFNQVVLTAPDLDAEIFRRQIMPAICNSARRMTMYASSRDRALLASQLLHKYPRAGFAGDDLVVIKGLDTIDASAVNTDILGHDVMSESPLIDDLFQVVCRECPPEDRRLHKREKETLPYWELPRQ